MHISSNFIHCKLYATAGESVNEKRNERAHGAKTFARRRYGRQESGNAAYRDNSQKT
jgi:hypothetical protein